MNTIPKVFHWIWLGEQPLPEQHRRWINGWLELHPGWEHVLWTDENRPQFVNEHEFRGADTFAQKADIARYELVHRHGGIYLDTDTECLRPIEPLLEGLDAFVVVEEPGTYATYFIGATPGHPWLGDVIARLPESMRTAWSNMHQAGPRFLTTVTEGRSDVAVLEQSVFANGLVPEAVRTRAYAVHHEAWTWRQAARARWEAKLRELATEDIEPVVPEGALVVLVDKGHGLDLSGGRRSVPFPEQDGSWAGYPADDAEAIAELERLREQGARFIVFPAPMRYWLDAYPGVAEYLARGGRRVVDNDRALIVELLELG